MVCRYGLLGGTRALGRGRGGEAAHDLGAGLPSIFFCRVPLTGRQACRGTFHTDRCNNDLWHFTILFAAVPLARPMHHL